MRRILFGSRKRIVLSGMVVAFAAGGTAFAAWQIFTGGSGTAAGKFQTATTSQAVTLGANPAGVVTPIAPGTTGDLAFKATSSSSVDETITGVTGTFTSTPSDCASHLTLNSAAFNGKVVPAGSSGYGVDVAGAVTADASLPNDCSGGSFTANLTATTSP